MASWECCKSFLYTVGFCILLFVGIPIKIDRKEARNFRQQFASYAREFNKSYSLSSDDYSERLAAFEKAVTTIESWNAARKSNYSALYGLTKFVDLTPEEFSVKYLRKHHRTREYSSHSHHRNHLVSKRAIIPSLPEKVDWRAKGVVTSVKDQGTCGACWAFSTVAAIESMLAIKTGKLTDLSVQEVIDCAGYGNMGCNGGDFCALVEWITTYNVSITTASTYPLVLKNDVCHLKKDTPGVRVSKDFECDFVVGEEHKILKSLAEHGPVVVAVNAISWMYYLGGVIQDNCPGDPTLLNHAVVLVGYDLTAPIPFYIAKNSWGKRFGDGGHVKIAVGSNVCGIANEIMSLNVL